MAFGSDLVVLRGGLTVPVEGMLLVFQLQKRGFSLTPDGDGLVVRPHDKLTGGTATRSGGGKALSTATAPSVSSTNANTTGSNGNATTTRRRTVARDGSAPARRSWRSLRAAKGDAETFWNTPLIPSCAACNSRKSIEREGGFGRTPATGNASTWRATTRTPTAPRTDDDDAPTWG
jgi:hypothetical protein